MTQQVVLGEIYDSGSISNKICLNQGDPQRCIMGEIIYNLYAIGSWCRSQGVHFPSYADDQQDY